MDPGLNYAEQVFIHSQRMSPPPMVFITDKLRFYVGDYPAKQFEQGTQQGGAYKCGGCGVHSVMMGDLAHTLQLATLEEFA